MSSAILIFRNSSLALSQFHHAADGTLWLSYFPWCVHAKLLQLCLTLYNSTDCSPPGSSVQGVLQARILEWVAIPSSKGSSQPRDQIHVSCGSCIGRSGFFTTKATWESLVITMCAKLLQSCPTLCDPIVITNLM